MAVEEGEEAVLEGAAGAAGGFAQVREGGADRAVAAVARVAIEQVGKGETVVETQVFRLAQGGLDRAWRPGREVEDRARDGGDRDAVMDRDLVGRQAGLVPTDRPMRLSLPGGGDVDRAIAVVADAPERRGRVVAEYGPWAAGEHRRHPTGVG